MFISFLSYSPRDNGFICSGEHMASSKRGLLDLIDDFINRWEGKLVSDVFERIETTKRSLLNGNLKFYD